MHAILFSALSFAGAAYGHGMVIRPPARAVGTAFKAACGDQMFNNQKSDPFGNIQGMRQVADANFDASECQLELCKAFKFADNTANVQSFSLGQDVTFKVEIRAPHTGVANVSVVNTGTNSIIGEPLISFENYASTKTGVSQDNLDFRVKIPDSLPSACNTAGNCVLQWWWDSPEAKQTYMSCVDFTAGSGSGSGSGSISSSSSPASRNTSCDSATVAQTTATASTSTIAVRAVSSSFTAKQLIAWLNEVSSSSFAMKFSRHARDFKRN